MPRKMAKVLAAGESGISGDLVGEFISGHLVVKVYGFPPDSFYDVAFMMLRAKMPPDY
jgi:hypothetical protein